jgi:hypothetical protein
MPIDSNAYRDLINNCFGRNVLIKFKKKDSVEREELGKVVSKFSEEKVSSCKIEIEGNTEKILLNEVISVDPA